MKIFRYQVAAGDGKKISGTVEAPDEITAVEMAREQGTLLKIEEAKTNSLFTDSLKQKLNEPTRISEKTISLISSQFAILLRAGIPTPRAIRIVAEQTADKYLKQVFNAVAVDVEAGFSMSASLENHGRKIPGTFIETVRAGEESGSLDRSFERLVSYYDKAYKLRGKVKSALSYPAFLMVLSVVVVAVVINVAVPVMADLINSTGGELPGPTRLLMGIYNFFLTKWWIVLLLVIAVVIAVVAYRNTEKGRYNMSKWGMTLPIIGHLNMMNGASQFANTMNTLLASGLPTSRAIEITGKVVDSYALGKELQGTISGLNEGKTLGQVLKPNKFMPDLLKEMAEVGDESGALEETLGTIGLYFDNEADQAATKALGILEPAMTVFLGVVIGFIVIALYLPMFTMYNGM